MSGSKKIAFKSGESIFSEGDPGDVAYVVIEGEIDIVSESSGATVHIATISKHGIFGEMALLDNTARSATAIAKTDCACVVIDHKQFNDAMDRAEPLIRGILRILASNLRATTERLVGESTHIEGVEQDVKDISENG